jgi:hypothetical protein
MILLKIVVFLFYFRVLCELCNFLLLINFGENLSELINFERIYKNC